jgi:dihydrodipicolinate synthase/N-acetylneuraminate lyase
MTILSGVFPVVPTTFQDDGDLDLHSQRRVIDFLVDAGAHGVCILANWSEQFALTDAERERLTNVVLEHVAGRLPVIVTTSHYSTRVAAARSKQAQDAGAAMVMVMPPYHGATIRVTEAGILEHLAGIAAAIDIPIMVQDAPMAGTPLPVALLARIAREIPAARYFKLENDKPPDKLRELIRLGGNAVEGPWDGEESLTLIPDLEAGATGTMPGATCPDALVEVWQAWHSGEREAAIARFERLLPLISYENRVAGILASKVVLAAGGVIASDAGRHPLPRLSEPTRARLVELARRLDLLALRWAA